MNFFSLFCLLASLVVVYIVGYIDGKSNQRFKTFKLLINKIEKMLENKT